MSEKRFNIRVYGILCNDKDEVLIADERRNGISFTKFPGGGLEWGEGLKECLQREFLEELGIDITINELYYCTDFFVESAWNKNDQLISIYFNVDYAHKNELIFPDYSLPFLVDDEKFRWVKKSELSDELFTYPIDKYVGERIRKLDSK